MKNLLLVLVLSMAGCVSEVVESNVRNNSARSDAFLQRMDEGQTTREQEQDFIKANRVAWHALNYHLNDVDLPEDLRSSFDHQNNN